MDVRTSFLVLMIAMMVAAQEAKSQGASASTAPANGVTTPTKEGSTNGTTTPPTELPPTTSSAETTPTAPIAETPAVETPATAPTQPAEVATELEFRGRYYARTSLDFRTAEAEKYWDGEPCNVVGVLHKGVRARLIKWEATEEGNLAAKVLVLDGRLANREVFFYYGNNEKHAKVKWSTVAATPATPAAPATPVEPAVPATPDTPPATPESASEVLPIPAAETAPNPAVQAPVPAPVQHKLPAKYALGSLEKKLVDNRGNGYERLYGTRNVRVVLKDLVFRGGANNRHNKHGKKANGNPLPKVGLRNLCREGFDTAIYLYPTNYTEAPNEVECKLRKPVGGEAKGNLSYLNVSAFGRDREARKILELVHDRLQQPAPKPIYLHCWNGWHASGYVSALILRQFCGVSASDAVDYWNRNTDGDSHGKGHERIRERIRRFKPFSDLSISEETRQRFCLQK